MVYMDAYELVLTKSFMGRPGGGRKKMCNRFPRNHYLVWWVRPVS